MTDATPVLPDSMKGKRARPFSEEQKPHQSLSRLAKRIKYHRCWLVVVVVVVVK